MGRTITLKYPGVCTICGYALRRGARREGGMVSDYGLAAESLEYDRFLARPQIHLTVAFYRDGNPICGLSHLEATARNEDCVRAVHAHLTDPAICEACLDAWNEPAPGHIISDAEWEDKDPGSWTEADALHAGLAEAEQALQALKVVAQLACDTMQGYNDTGEFDEALSALASCGITPSTATGRVQP